MMKMKAAVLEEYGKPLVVKEVEIDDPKKGEVLVHIGASGICGSDVLMSKGMSNIKSLPIILGHEGAGVVEKVGEGVTDLKVGDKVVIAMSDPCGECPECRSGNFNRCRNSMNGVVGNMRDGTLRKHLEDQDVYSFVGIGSFAEYTVVNRNRLIKADPEAKLESICLVPCGVITGTGAVFNASDVKPGSTVLVFGSGGVGTSVIQGSKIAGASTIIAVDLNPEKLEYAKKMGASDVILSPANIDDLEAEVKKICPMGVDVAFDCVGRDPNRIPKLMNLTARGGLTVAVGMIPWNQSVPVNAKDIMLLTKRLTGISGGNGIASRDIPDLLKLYKNRRLNLDDMVGNTYTLDEINEAMNNAMKSNGIRTVVRISPELL